MATLSAEERRVIQAIVDAAERLKPLLVEDDGQPVPEGLDAPIAWGSKVSPTFRNRARWIALDLFPYPGSDDDLMSCMAWESGRSFSPSKRNMAGSGATGLIQFMPDTMFLLKHGRARYDATPKAERIRQGKVLCDQIAKLSAEDQLNWVWKYFAPYEGRIKNLSDMYMAILWPSAVGKPDDYVLFDGRSGGIAYRQNAGLDINKDKLVTKAEAAAKVYALKAEGLRLAA